jgi:hypothetical protein
MRSTELCTYKDCSVAPLCKRSTQNTKPAGEEQAYLKEIELDDNFKCTSFLPLHREADALFRMASFPARDTKRFPVSEARPRGKAKRS